VKGVKKEKRKNEKEKFGREGDLARGRMLGPGCKNKLHKNPPREEFYMNNRTLCFLILKGERNNRRCSLLP